LFVFTYWSDDEKSPDQMALGVVSKGSALKISPDFISIFLAKTFHVFETWKV